MVYGVMESRYNETFGIMVSWGYRSRFSSSPLQYDSVRKELYLLESDYRGQASRSFEICYDALLAFVLSDFDSLIQKRA